MLDSVGEPTSLKIRTHWSTSVRPSRIGFLSNISPKTQLLLVSEVVSVKSDLENVPYTPHVDSRRIFFHGEQKLWWPVPSGDDKTGIVSHGFAVALPWLRHYAFIVAGKTEIGDLQDTGVGNEDIGGFHVAVENM